MPSTPARGAHRLRAAERREPRLHVWLTAAEWDTVTAAPARAGMAPGAYAAQALLDVAENRTVNLSRQRREMIVALMQAAAHVSRIGTRLDEAVAQLKATGTPSLEFEPTARQAARMLRAVDEAAELVRRML